MWIFRVLHNQLSFDTIESLRPSLGVNQDHRHSQLEVAVLNESALCAAERVISSESLTVVSLELWPAGQAPVSPTRLNLHYLVPAQAIPEALALQVMLPLSDESLIWQMSRDEYKYELGCLEGHGIGGCMEEFNISSTPICGICL